LSVAGGTSRPEGEALGRKEGKGEGRKKSGGEKEGRESVDNRRRANKRNNNPKVDCQQKYEPRKATERGGNADHKRGAGKRDDRNRHEQGLLWGNVGGSR